MKNSHNLEKRSNHSLRRRSKAHAWLRLGLLALVLHGVACGDAEQFGGRSASGALCSDGCRFALDGACDDGGSGSSYSECQYGSDCSDCGPRDPQEYNCCNDYRFFEDEMACMSGLKDCP